ncbi:MAG: outer membrane lipoprotein-sorting protein [Planctomycetes bacterium]|nr:outer membrane lipoprotein-sorting protein [Planctomycetota bacterium]
MPKPDSRLNPVESRLLEVTARLESREREIAFVRDAGLKYRLLVAFLAVALLGAGGYAGYLALAMRAAAAAREVETRLQSKTQEALQDLENRLRAQIASDLKNVEGRLAGQIALEVRQFRDDVAGIERRSAQWQKELAEVKAFNREVLAALTAPGTAPVAPPGSGPGATPAAGTPPGTAPGTTPGVAPGTGTGPGAVPGAGTPPGPGGGTEPPPRAPSPAGGEKPPVGYSPDASGAGRAAAPGSASGAAADPKVGDQAPAAALDPAPAATKPPGAAPPVSPGAGEAGTPRGAAKPPPSTPPADLPPAARTPAKQPASAGATGPAAAATAPPRTGAAPSGAPSGELDGRAVVQRSKELTLAHSETSDVSMKLLDLATGKDRVRKLQSWSLRDANGKSKKLTRFTEPGDIKGTGFLTIENQGREDDQWLYLPAMRKTKRISASEKTDLFMGSDFTYEDMQSEDLSSHEYRLVANETVDGAGCFVIEASPSTDKARKESGYARRVIWFRQDNFFPILTRFYAKDGTELKTEKAIDLNPAGRYWRPRRTEMVDLKRNHKTVLSYQNVRLDEGVEEGLFTTRELERER